MSKNRGELKDAVRKLRKLRLILYPGEYNHDTAVDHIGILDTIFSQEYSAEVKDVYLKEVRPTIKKESNGDISLTPEELRELRGLLTEIIISFQDQILE